MITKEMLRAAKLIAAWPAGPGRHAVATVFANYFELASMAAVRDFFRLCDVETAPLDPGPIMWDGKPMREGRCPPGNTCLACDLLGRHLEPIEPAS